MSNQKKSLGQHWLKDIQTLEAIAEAAEIRNSDTILEIGPGLGTLTKYLIEQASHVIAIEKDTFLASRLLSQDLQRLQIVKGDILEFDLTNLPAGYKVVANIPYYLTSNLLRVLSESSNPPKMMVLLMQKEVAQRVCAKPGHMSILAVSTQLYYQSELGISVPAEMFEPPPKVDSQVLILKKRSKPLFYDIDSKLFFKVVKAGFSAKRKKLSGALSGSLNLSKEDATALLEQAGVDPGLRAQNLSLEQWYQLYLVYPKYLIQ